MARPREIEYLMTPKERRDLRALRILLAGGSPTEAAARVGVSERTIHRRGLVRLARQARKPEPAKAGRVCTP